MRIVKIINNVCCGCFYLYHFYSIHCFFLLLFFCCALGKQFPSIFFLLRSYFQMRCFIYYTCMKAKLTFTSIIFFFYIFFFIYKFSSSFFLFFCGFFYFKKKLKIAKSRKVSTITTTTTTWNSRNFCSGCW